MVGTIAASHLRVEAEVDDGAKVTARLSGVEIIDCTLSGKKHPVICKVGNLSGTYVLVYMCLVYVYWCTCI